MAMVDGVRISQVLDNLISQAIIASHDGVLSLRSKLSVGTTRSIVIPDCVLNTELRVSEATKQ